MSENADSVTETVADTHTVPPGGQSVCSDEAYSTGIADLLTQLRERVTALGDGRDCRSDNERADYHARSRTLGQILAVLANAPADVKRLQRRLDLLYEARGEALEKRAALEAEIATFPDWRGIRDARERDKELARQQNVRHALQRLNEGTLYRSPSETYELVDHLDRRIEELTARRDRVQASLDSAVTLGQSVCSVTPA